MIKPKVIIYGLGQQWKEKKHYLGKLFDILACSDSKTIDVEYYIRPEEICKYDYRYVYITSDRYFDEIKDELVEKYSIDEEKIIGEKDTCLYLDNSLVRKDWIRNELNEIPEGRILLDAGAGEQRYKKYCSHLKYISQDFCQYDASKEWGGGCTQRNGILQR